MTTKSPQEIEDYLAQNEDNPNRHYGVRIFPVESVSGPSYRVEILVGFGWPNEHKIEGATMELHEVYPFGSDQELYRLLDKFNGHCLEMMDEDEYEDDPHVYVASGSFYKDLDGEVPDAWLNDVEMIKL